LLSLLGGLAVSGLLADARFATEISYFRGVKLSYVVPPAVALVGGVGLLLDRPVKVPARDLASRVVQAVRAIAVRDVEVWHILASLAGLAAAVIYVGRSGDQPWLPVSDLEVAARDWLDRTFHAQPRVKEFLIGYPALAIGSYLAWAGRRAWLPVWAAAGGMGLVSIVNSFEHVRTPLALTLMRTVNGAVLGVVVGGLLVAALAAVIRRLVAADPASEPHPAGAAVDGPGRGGRPLHIFGVRIDPLTLEQAAAAVTGYIRDAGAVGSAGPVGSTSLPGSAGSTGTARLVFTPNPEILYQARRDAEFRHVLNTADLLVPDGVGVLWASGLAGRPLGEIGRAHV